MQKALDPAVAEQLLKNIVIPPRPAILAELDREQRREEPDFDRISQLISSDLTLSAAVLKTINSPLMKLPQKISSVNHALQLLGLNNVCNIVQGLSLGHIMPKKPGAQLEQFWESSNRIAMISAYLAGGIHGISEDEAHTFGMFHNCGQPLMAARYGNYPESMRKGERMSREEFIALEISRHNTSHNVVGYLLARAWLLPEPMTLAILNHHDYAIFDHPEDGDWHHVCTLIAIASLSEHIFKMYVKQFEHVEWRLIEPKLLNHLALELEEFEDMVDAVHDMLINDSN
ncbi:HDOD domain-containing protein [Chitinilyticum piscinae]|uniref:HDOD domain-containing protein n=1 Tax=Chitinilyticum piscinae TaxID=2866724 RepID=A0A8J7G0G0_9NEIS|nr:HDOD domain-containing protein [Chitinilyticum piscinae]MBE9609695.1 HDOD domain-containing protein [Chitinilyticum piscinae]